LLGNWSAVLRVVFRPLDDALLNAPDHAPDVQHHDPSDAAANPDGESAIALPTVIVHGEKQVRRTGNNNGVNDGDDGPLVEYAFAGKKDCVEDCPDDGPDDKKTAHDGPGGGAAVASVDRHNVPVICKTSNHRDDGGHAEPPQRAQHEWREDFAPG